MEFRDFANNYQELVGKTVLYEYGMSYSDSRRKALISIEKVTKTGFKLNSMPNELFSLINGHQKGLNGKMNMGVVSMCRLVTDEEANKIREEWKAKKNESQLRAKMAEKFKTMTFEQLQKMELI